MFEALIILIRRAPYYLLALAQRFLPNDLELLKSFLLLY